MAETFSFNDFLMDQDFSFTNEGHTQFYHKEKSGTQYRIELNGDKLKLSNSKDEHFEADIKQPRTAKEAGTFLKGFLK